MMSEAMIRTEDLDPREIMDFFVETENDRDIINALKSKQPVLLVGSRGTGKTMLLKVAEQELNADYEKSRILPVFVNLVTCTIHNNENLLKILISRTLIALRASLRNHGIVLKGSLFEPRADVHINPIAARLEEYINKTTEESREDGYEINDTSIREDVAKLIEFLKEICDNFNITRISFFFDEACQVFQPTQQRIFFDYFRALRTYNISCNAAVYPGITTYGTFQNFHDATVKRIERSITSANYIANMREVIEKHYPKDFKTFIQQGELLDAIIYASTGNPRFLIKSINEILSGNGKFTRSNVNQIVKNFYGTAIWTEHTKLGDIYPGHKKMIDWSRIFIEDSVIPDICKYNEKSNKKSTIYFAVSRNSPEVVKQAIKTLEYSGIVSLHTEGTKFRTEMYDRYEINLGIIVLFEKQTILTDRINEIAKNLSVRLFPNYGSNSASFGDYSQLKDITEAESAHEEIFSYIKNKSIEELDISNSLLTRLLDAGYTTIGQILEKTEDELQNIKYIGPGRARIINNLVYNSILEYISG